MWQWLRSLRHLREQNRELHRLILELRSELLSEQAWASIQHRQHMWYRQEAARLQQELKA